MSAATQKGTRWETALVRALGAVGISAYRPRAQGAKDVGDLHGLSPFVGQAKDWRDWASAMREGLDGAEKQVVHAGESYGVAFVKRVRRPAEEGYAVMTVRTFSLVLNRLRNAEQLLGVADSTTYQEHMSEHYARALAHRKEPE